MKEFIATISTTGQVTIPEDVRRQLGVNAPDQVAFVVNDAGSVELRAVGLTLESVLGSLPALENESVDLDNEINEAIAEDVAHSATRSRRK